MRKLLGFFWLVCAVHLTRLAWPGIELAWSIPETDFWAHIAWLIPAAICFRLFFVEMEGEK